MELRVKIEQDKEKISLIGLEFLLLLKKYNLENYIFKAEKTEKYAHSFKIKIPPFNKEIYNFLNDKVHNKDDNFHYWISGYDATIKKLTKSYSFVIVNNKEMNFDLYEDEEEINN